MSDPVLLLRPDKAGDAIKSLPAIRALKMARPELDLHVLASEHNASLFENEPGITVHELPEDWENWRSNRLRSYLLSQGMPQAFGAAVSLLCDYFPNVQKLLLGLPAAKKFSVTRLNWVREESAALVAIHLPNRAPEGRDETSNIADILSAAFTCDLAPHLAKMDRAPVLNAADRASAVDLLPETAKKRLGLCPFAGTAQRSPNLGKWKRLVKKLVDAEPNTEWVIFAPASGLDAARELVPPHKGDAFRIVSAPSFRVLAACFERLDAILAVDSGPLHLAQAMNVPSLGFLSGGDRDRWFGRLGSKDRLLSRGIFSRFPSTLEMWWAFRRWVAPQRGSV